MIEERGPRKSASSVEYENASGSEKFAKKEYPAMTSPTAWRSTGARKRVCRAALKEASHENNRASRCTRMGCGSIAR
jgi:hypothetical protein